jgi:hypothetical protein
MLEVHKLYHFHDGFKLHICKLKKKKSQINSIKKNDSNKINRLLLIYYYILFLDFFKS